LRRRPAAGAGLWADERTRILRVLEANRWNRQRAAAALGISRVTLWRRMERHGIRDPLATAAGETA
jgi:transcriptional regulator of acetoin/glycerol metabolism